MITEHRVTLAEVARTAGVHRTTVSMALRDHPRLPRNTRERLKTLATLLGYRPDPALAALNAYRVANSHSSHHTGVAYLQVLHGCEERIGQTHGLLFEGAREQAERLGYRMNRFWLGEGGMRPEHVCRILRARGIRAFIIASGEAAIPLPALDWNECSTVRIGHYPLNLRVPAIAHNYLQITRTALEQLQARGFRRIGIATSSRDDRKQMGLIRGGIDQFGLNSGVVDQAPLLIFPDSHMSQGLLDQVRVWGTHHRLDAFLSNWDFSNASLQREGFAPPLSVPFFGLDVPREDLSGGGIVQNHQLLGRLAMEQLAALVRAHRTGMEQFPSLTLVEGYWRDGPGLAPQQDSAQAARSPERSALSLGRA